VEREKKTSKLLENGAGTSARDTLHQAAVLFLVDPKGEGKNQKALTEHRKTVVG